MFSNDQIEEILGLHEKSYTLLKWVNNSLGQAFLKFDVMHQAMTASDAANEWMKRHYDNIPLATRPTKSKINAFANLFASYLTTSFDIIEKPGKQLKSDCGCFCSFCSYLSTADHLKVRKPSKNAHKDAKELKRVYLTTLSEELELPLIIREIDQLVDDKDISRAISLTTYFNELMRRTQFVSQGEGVLVLWREIAWEGTAPKKGFKLRVTDILDAENKIINKMKQF